MPSPPKTVTLYGASGLVGGHCLTLLLEHPSVEHVVAPGRRPLPSPPPDPRLSAPIVSFDDLDPHRPHVRSDAVICALGTTRRQAGSRERFRKVDHDYPLDIARAALDEGTPHFLLVSSVGANAGAFFFYSRVKGELERDLQALGFAALTILRPSLLVGERPERRLVERISARLSRLAPGKYRSIKAEVVARALVDQAGRASGGVRILESDVIERTYGR